MNNYSKTLVRVINISSIYGTVAINRTLQEFSKTPVPMNYSVCKAALIQMTKEFTAKYGDANSHLTLYHTVVFQVESLNYLEKSIQNFHPTEKC